MRRSTILILVAASAACAVDGKSGTPDGAAGPGAVGGPGRAGGDAGAPEDDGAGSSAASACDSDNDCTPLGLLCDLERARCVSCVSDGDCSAPEQCEDGACLLVTTCKNSLDCIDAPADQGICDRDAERCVECVANPDCDGDQHCVEHVCTTVEHCDNALDCELGQVCNTSTALCVECVAHADCAANELCGDDNACREGCDSDNDCTPLGQLCDRAAGHCIEPNSGVRGGVRDVRFDTIDLLFVVDNSGSMREEQEALRIQFPRLIDVLTTGDRDGDGAEDFPPLTDVHLGVVSSDMGLHDIQNIPSCDQAGDDGVMNNLPSAAVTGCLPSYPRFISYDASSDSAPDTARDFACLATLGTDGCGFEQPLEAGLKALWPSTGTGITFLGATQGQGDGPNAGFLRSDPNVGLSLIGIIIVSDEEDCSAHDTRIFTAPVDLESSDPLKAQDLNLRCFLNKEALYDVQRYVDGFRNLRAGLEELVTFGAIVGVPADLVSPERRAAVDFSNVTQRESYYDTILRDPRMIEAQDLTRPPEQGQNLRASCETPSGRAFPPRRIVEVARRFGENGVVQSICLDDFTGAMDAVIGAIIRQR